MKRHPNEEIIYALFDDAATVEKTYRELLTAGIDVDDISLLMNEDTHDRDFKALDRTRTGRGATAGTILGGTLGGVVGGLAALGTALSGVGLIVAGPMLALAAAGGLIGGLIGHGMPAEEVERLKNALHEGRAMIAVHVHRPEDKRAARRVFKLEHGEEVELRA